MQSTISRASRSANSVYIMPAFSFPVSALVTPSVKRKMSQNLFWLLAIRKLQSAIQTLNRSCMVSLRLHRSIQPLNILYFISAFQCVMNFCIGNNKVHCGSYWGNSCTIWILCGNELVLLVQEKEYKVFGASGKFLV